MRHLKLPIAVGACITLGGAAIYTLNRANLDPDSQATLAVKWLPEHHYAQQGKTDLNRLPSSWAGPTLSLPSLDAALANLPAAPVGDPQIVTRDTLLFTRKALDFLARSHPCKKHLAASVSLVEEGKLLRARIDRLPEEFPTQKKLKATLKIWLLDWIDDRRDAEGLLPHFAILAKLNSDYALDLGDPATHLARWRESVTRFSIRTQKLFGEEFCAPTIYNGSSDKSAFWLKPDGSRPASWYYLQDQLRTAERKSTEFAWNSYTDDALPLAAPIIAAQGAVESRNTAFRLNSTPDEIASARAAMDSVLKSAPAGAADSPLGRLIRSRLEFIAGFESALATYDNDFGRLASALRRLSPSEPRIAAERDELAAWCEKRHSVHIPANAPRTTAAQAAVIHSTLRELVTRAPWAGLKKDLLDEDAEWPALTRPPERTSIKALEDEIALLNARLARNPPPLLRRITEDRRKSAGELLAITRALCTAGAMDTLPEGLFSGLAAADLPADSAEGKATTELLAHCERYAALRAMEASPDSLGTDLETAWAAFMAAGASTPFSDDIRAAFLAPAQRYESLARGRLIAKALRREHLRPLLPEHPSKVPPSERRFGIEVIRETLGTLALDDAEPAAFSALSADFARFDAWRAALDAPTRARLYDPAIAPLVRAASIILESRAALQRPSPQLPAITAALAHDDASGLKSTNPELSAWRKSAVTWLRRRDDLCRKITEAPVSASAITAIAADFRDLTKNGAAPTPAIETAIINDAAPWLTLANAGADHAKLEAAWISRMSNPGTTDADAIWALSCLSLLTQNHPLCEKPAELPALTSKINERITSIKTRLTGILPDEVIAERTTPIIGTWDTLRRRTEFLTDTSPPEPFPDLAFLNDITLNQTLNRSLEKLRVSADYWQRVIAAESAWSDATGEGAVVQRWHFLKTTLDQATLAAKTASEKTSPLEKGWIAAFRERLLASRAAITLDHAEWESAETIAGAHASASASAARWNTPATPSLAALWASKNTALEQLDRLLNKDLELIWDDPDDRNAFDCLENPTLIKWLAVNPHLAEDLQNFAGDLIHLPDILRTDSGITVTVTDPLNFEGRAIERALREAENKSHLNHRWISPRMNTLRAEAASIQDTLHRLSELYRSAAPADAAKVAPLITEARKNQPHMRSLRRLLSAHLARAEFFSTPQPYRVNLAAAYQDENGIMGHAKAWKIGIDRKSQKASSGHFDGCVNDIALWKARFDTHAMMLSAATDQGGQWCYVDKLIRVEDRLQPPVYWKMGDPVTVAFKPEGEPAISAIIGERNTSDTDIIAPAFPAHFEGNWAMRRLQDGAANYKKLSITVAAPRFPWPVEKALWNQVKFPSVAPAKLNIGKTAAEALRDLQESNLAPIAK